MRFLAVHAPMLIAAQLCVTCAASDDAEHGVAGDAQRLAFSADMKLLGYWSFDRQYDIPGQSIKYADDNTDKGQAAEVENATWTADGRSNGGLYFNGTDSYVDIPDDRWNAGSPITYNLWYKVDGTATGYVVEHAFTTKSAGGFAVDAAGAKFRSYDATRTVADQGYGPVTAGAWTMLTIVLDGTSIRVYRDGTKISTLSRKLPKVAGSLHVGASAVQQNTFKGWVDEIAVFGLALTDAQVTALRGLYDVPVVPGTVDNGLLASFTFDDGTAKDVSGNQNDGQIFNTTVEPNGRFGKALYFNGTNAYMYVPDGTWNRAAPITFNAWVKPQGSPNGFIFDHHEGFESGGSFSVRFDSGDGLRFSAFDSTNANPQWLGTPIAADMWTMITVVFTETEMRAYKNGTLWNKLPMKGFPQSRWGMHVGGSDPDSWGYFKGWIDDISIHGTALSDSEIQVLVQTSDSCPSDPNKVLPGVCGCGMPDVDYNNDGQVDCATTCADCAKNPFCALGETSGCTPLACTSALQHPCATFSDAASQNQCGFVCKKCTPQCTGKTCGDDGCGGSCGTPSTTEYCTANGTRASLKAPGDGTLGRIVLPKAGIPTDITPTVAGTLPGQFKVTDFGQASYTIPLQVPAGRHGIEPSLSLSYNSASGNGYLGYGWSLDGLSVISRCGSTYAQDGRQRPVNNDKNDQFCLDGNRLVSAKAGQTYGADGTEYRTELDSYSQIIAHAKTATQPDSWEVRAKDGRIYFYRLRIGGTKPQNPRLNPVNFQDSYDPATSRADTWALSEVRDRFGNSMWIDYFSPKVDYQTGTPLVAVTAGETIGAEALVGLGGRVTEYYPWHIYYTRNDAAGLQPDRLIEFHYHARRDAIRAFDRGTRKERTLLLDKITASVAGVTAFEYGLTYTEPTYGATQPMDPTAAAEWLKDVAAQIHNPSQLKSVKECARSSVVGNGALVCLPATVFDYTGVTPGFDAPVNGSQVKEQYTGFIGDPIVLDMDGNGIDDLMIPRHASGDGTAALFQLSLNGADPGTTFPRWVLNESGAFRVAPTFVADFDGDGRDELVEVDPTRSNGTGRPVGALRIWSLDANQALQPREISELGGNATLTDANNDGLPDALICNGGTSVRLNSNGMLGAPAVLNKGSCYDMSTPIDIDGDGAREFMTGQTIFWGRDLKTADYEFNFGAQTDIVESSAITSYNYAAKIPLDVTGDGLDDIVSFSVKDNAVLTTIAESTGVGVIEWTQPGIFASFRTYRPIELVGLLGSTAVPYDYNHDGRMDLLVQVDYRKDNAESPRTPIWIALISLGNRFFVQAVPGLASSSRPVVYDENFDGVPDLAFIMPSGFDIGKPKVMRGRGPRTPRLTTITNGLGARVGIEYAELETPNVPGPVPLYAPMPDASDTCFYPISCRTPKWTVVRRHSEWDLPYNAAMPTAGARSWTYGYSGAATDLMGRGTLGFAVRAIVDEQAEARAKVDAFVNGLDLDNAVARTGIIYANTYEDETKHIFPFVGIAKTVISVVSPMAGYRQISTTDHVMHSEHTVPTDAGIGSVAGRVDRKQVTVTEEGGSAGPVMLTNSVATFSYDSFGNVKTTTTDFSDGIDPVRTSVTYNYESDPNYVTEWLIQAPSSVTSTAGTEVHTTTYAYDDVSGVPASSVLDPSDSLNALTTVYTVDDVGNLTHVETSTVPILGSPVTRTRSIAYDSERIHPALLTRENNQQITLFVDPALGLPISIQSPIKPGSTATQTVTEYTVPDGFGRPRLLVDTAGVATTINYMTLSAGGFSTTETRPGAPTVTTQYDVLGRVTKTSAPGPDGRVLSSQVFYNDLGLVDKQNRLRRDGTTDEWTSFDYDPLGRVKKRINPDGGETDIVYVNNVVCVRSPRGFFSCEQYDGRGNLRRVFDDAVSQPATMGVSLAAGYAMDNPVMAIYPPQADKGTRYNYSPAGRLLSTIDPAGNSVDRSYNTLGQLTSITDPDNGTWGYEYSQFRELLTETDAGKRTTTFFRDALGRLTLRVNTTSTGQTLNTTYTYDERFYGRLAYANGADGRVDLDYDDFGRQKLFQKTINSPSSSTPATLFYTLGYDDTTNLLSSQTFKTVDNVDVPLLYKYTGGYLTAITSSETAKPYWQLISTDDNGNLQEEKFQNDVSIKPTYWPHTDLVASLRGTNQGWSYTYDLNHNLQTRTSELATVETTTYVYDGMDRLTSATSVGTDTQSYKEAYTYDVLGNITSRSVTDGTAATVDRAFYYDDGTGRPHALKWVAAGLPKSPPNMTGAEHHEYDASGRLTTRSGGTRDPLNIQYNFLGLPSSMESPARDADDVSFGYDALGARIRKSGPSGDTFYLDDQYFRTRPGGTTGEATDHFSIQVGGRAVAELVRPTGGTITTYFVHTDRLDSVDTVENGTSLVERRNFEAFGKRRAATPAGATGIIRDFAGNELDPEFGLINMGARSYDPELGRFLQPDPLWTGSSPQWLNPYSYARNNPLRFTDRAGTCPIDGGPDGPNCPQGPDGPQWPKQPGGPDGGTPTCTPTYCPMTTCNGSVCTTTGVGGTPSDGNGSYLLGDGHKPVQTGPKLLPAIGSDTRSATSAMKPPPAQSAGQLLPGQTPQGAGVQDAYHANEEVVVALSRSVAAHTKPVEPLLHAGTIVALAPVSEGIIFAEGATAEFIGAAAAGKPLASIALNSSNALAGAERASAELLEAVGARRTVQIVAEGSEELRYLNAVGAEANVGGAEMNHILLRPNPSKAAVLEEFLHGTQHQLGIIARRGIAAAEWHVKDFMIRHARLLGLGAEDVERLTILRDMGL